MPRVTTLTADMEAATGNKRQKMDDVRVSGAKVGKGHRVFPNISKYGWNVFVL